ncbi:MAG TPA: squalene synthase HpnC [Streptosporangiaceae bacterium]|nr:squalene synthase HpnC [Streptosporangiaceae bacterium]
MTPEATRTGECRAPGAAGSPATAGSRAVAGSSATAITAQAGAKAAAENFPVALRFLPRGYRGHLAAVYGFARSADDMGDEAAPGERLALLDELEADLERLYRMVSRAGPAGGGPVSPGADGPPRLTVVRALAPAVAACGIPAQPFRDLIAANRMDQVVSRYPAYADLLEYCRLSANPVGRIVLHIFGAATPGREALSDRVCTALQLAEHWQDVAEDLRAGRIYLPQEDMDRFGCAEQDLAAARAAPRVRALIAFEERRARALLDAGAPIVGTLRGAARAAVAGYVAGGRAALAAIAASGHDVLRATPRPGKSRVAAELVKAYATGR